MHSQPPTSSRSPVCPTAAADTMPRGRSLTLEPEALQQDVPQSHCPSVRKETHQPRPQCGLQVGACTGPAWLITWFCPFLSRAVPWPFTFISLVSGTKVT